MGVVLMSKPELNRIDVLARLDASRLSRRSPMLPASRSMRVTMRTSPLRRMSARGKQSCC
jgi:hypothetical protein